MRLYTAGYEKRSIDEYLDLLEAARVDVLVDVRETAWSHKPGFSKTALQDMLSARNIGYVHARWAGNPKILRTNALSHADCLNDFETHVLARPIILERLEQLLDELDAEGLSGSFMCFERHPDDCHRGVLAKLLQARRRNLEVIHLGPGGCKRIAAPRTERPASRVSGTTGQLFRSL